MANQRTRAAGISRVIFIQPMASRTPLTRSANAGPKINRCACSPLRPLHRAQRPPVGSKRTFGDNHRSPCHLQGLLGQAARMSGTCVSASTVHARRIRRVPWPCVPLCYLHFDPQVMHAFGLCVCVCPGCRGKIWRSRMRSGNRSRQKRPISAYAHGPYGPK